MVECMFCKCFLETSHTKQSEKTGQDEDEHSEASCLQNAKNPLKNWEKWMIKRTNINKMLSAKLNRPPGELLMNAAEEYRNVKEEKVLFENMKINIDFDKYRGNPAFWNLPPSLEENCRTKCRKKCPCEDPVYFAVKTFKQKNEIPKVQYIGISNHIFEEKNVLPRTRNIYALWQKNPYRNAVMDKLRAKLKHLEPHRPDNSSLIVLGSQKVSFVDRKERTSSRIRSLSFSKESESSNFDLDINEFNDKIKTDVYTDVTIDVHDIDVVNLIINGTRIVPSQMQKGTLKIRVLYELEEVPKVPLTNYVKFENRGKSTLRLHFSKYEKYITFRDIVDTTRKPSSFYFDKRELLILPGKSIDFPIWFKPGSTGHFFESWKITTSPQIWSDNCNLLLVFQDEGPKTTMSSLSRAQSWPLLSGAAPVEDARNIAAKTQIQARRFVCRHYYPEGGWGWVVTACAVLVHVINHGVQLSCSQLVAPAAFKFHVNPVYPAGELIV